MSVFKSQFSRALAVIKSDSADVPFPATNASGTNTSVSVSSLIDSAATFETNNVKTGDIVYNTTDGNAATVLVVVSETALLLNDDIFAASGKNYTIYQASPQTSNGNPGCNLYIGGAGNVKVTTIGGDVITFTATPVGQVLPVQVIKVHSTGTSATLINALW
jgi:5-deoxy-D-glucuronate isomerase